MYTSFFHHICCQCLHDYKNGKIKVLNHVIKELTYLCVIPNKETKFYLRANQNDFYPNIWVLLSCTSLALLDLSTYRLTTSWPHFCLGSNGSGTSEDLFWKLDALQTFIKDLHWPEEEFAKHLEMRLKLMSSDMIESCVKRSGFITTTPGILCWLLPTCLTLFFVQDEGGFWSEATEKQPDDRLPCATVHMHHV